MTSLRPGQLVRLRPHDWKVRLLVVSVDVLVSGEQLTSADVLTVLEVLEGREEPEADRLGGPWRSTLVKVLTPSGTVGYLSSLRLEVVR